MEGKLSVLFLITICVGEMDKCMEESSKDEIKQCFKNASDCQINSKIEKYSLQSCCKLQCLSEPCDGGLCERIVNCDNDEGEAYIKCIRNTNFWWMILLFVVIAIVFMIPICLLLYVYCIKPDYIEPRALADKSSHGKLSRRIDVMPAAESVRSIPPGSYPVQEMPMTGPGPPYPQ